jgi:hypothetical protein
VIQEFHKRFFEALKARYGSNPQHWVARNTDAYIHGKIEDFIKEIRQPYSHADWYRDNPTIREVGKAMGYKTAKLFREAMKQAEYPAVQVF